MIYSLIIKSSDSRFEPQFDKHDSCRPGKKKRAKYNIAFIYHFPLFH